jgi:uncharacterized protein (DUF362 family)
MKRREFIRSGFHISGGILLTSPLLSLAGNYNISAKSRVVLARDAQVQNEKYSVDTDRLHRLLDKGIQTFFNTDDPLQGWKKIVKPGEVVGLKVNCLSGHGATHRELVTAVCERLQQSGVKAENIIIWERFTSDLEDGGFKINQQEKGVRCFGNDYLGFSSDFEIYGSAASLICNTLQRLCDVVINLPVLKDHGIAGMTMTMKNMFGAIHNPNKYHLNVGNPYVADVFMLPSIRDKVRLTICDALVAQYEGGPSFMPHWRWAYNGLLIGNDPVALDYSGWQIIEQQRKKQGLKSLAGVGREPKYIYTAGDPEHRLGTCDPEKIELIPVG